MSQSHLTDEQFTQLLSDQIAVSTLPHLQACEQCRRELGRVQTALGDFSTLTLLDAEARAALHIRPMRGRTWSRRLSPTLQAMAAAACISVALLFGIHSGTILHPQGAAGGSSAARHQTASIDEDNRLLLSIDNELARQEDSPVSSSELNTAQHPHAASAERAD